MTQMFLLEKLESQIKQFPQRIAFTDGDDPRVMRAARKYLGAGFGVPALIGNAHKINAISQNLNMDLEGITIVDPQESEWIPEFQDIAKIHPVLQNLTEEETLDYVKKPNAFGALMLECGHADTLLVGASAKVRTVMPPIKHFLGRNQLSDEISSMILLDSRNSSIGANGLLFVSDAILHPDPSDAHLAKTAISLAQICKHMVLETPRVGLLGHTNANHASEDPSTKKMQSAAQMARDLAESIHLDCEVAGEIQADVALDTSIARLKEKYDLLQGNANVLIFPNLDAANISLKLLQVIADVGSYGSVLLGFQHAVGCISRSMQSKDIYGTAVLLAYLALHDYLLEPLAKEFASKIPES